MSVYRGLALSPTLTGRVLEAVGLTFILTLGFPEHKMDALHGMLAPGC